MSNKKDHALNLPRTNFPMRANLPKLEQKMLKWWDEIDLYERVRKSSKDRKKSYILHDGPPYANGQLHIGHALNKILKDIIVKSRCLDGFDAPYVPGWDCHGLPIEHEVEKKMGRGKARANPAEFRTACRNYAQSQIEVQRKGFIRMGIIGDWKNPYRTMAYETEADIIRSLGRICENGHLRYGRMPVYWCRDCRSALAEAEIEYRDHASGSIDVSYPLTDATKLKSVMGVDGINKACVVIWTTTAWTLPASQAVAVNADFDYVLISCERNKDREYLIMAQGLLEEMVERCALESVRILAHCKGADLAALRLHHPYLKERTMPVICCDYVTLDEGTGCVHTAPAHGREDFDAGVRYNLDALCPVDERGIFFDQTPLVAGMTLQDASVAICEQLSNLGRLLSSKDYEHSYPHCWRHKSPILFRTTEQWFVDLDVKELRKNALKAIEQVQFVPDWGRSRLTAMIENRPHWCLSRQRHWGVPITFWIHKQTRELHPDTARLIEEVAQRVEKKGIEAWFELDSSELLGAQAEQYQKVQDVLDVWFDSGSSHFAVLNQRPLLRNPADMYLEGSDQHRGWFQSSLLTSCAIYGRAPYHTLLTHGFTVDEHGLKMSKSLGNTVDIHNIMTNNGAEILRLWVASVDYSGEVAVSQQIFERVTDSYRRVRNTARFILGNLYDFNKDKVCAPTSLTFIDRWALDDLGRLHTELRQHYEEFSFHQVYHRIRRYCVVTLGGFYLDVLKDRLYTYSPDSHERRSAQTVLHHIIEVLVHMIAPILSFTAEEIWQQLPNRPTESIFEHQWSAPPTVELSDEERKVWELLFALRKQVQFSIEEMRKEELLGGSLEACVRLYADADSMRLLQVLPGPIEVLLAELLIVSKVELCDTRLAKEVELNTDVGHMSIAIEAIDLPKCPRCWRRVPELVGGDDLSVCNRCHSSLKWVSNE